MAYDITANKIVKTEVSPEELTAHQRIAERLLGFAGVAELTDTAKEEAEAAIATQVEYQLSAGVNAFIYSQQIRGARQETFRGGGRRMPPIHPIAKKLATALLNTSATEPVR